MASSGSRMLTAGVADDVQPNGRASSLIRMWRELEAEAGAGLASNHCAESAADAVASDGSGWVDGLGDWTSDAMTTASSEPASSFPYFPFNEIDQSRVGDNDNKAGMLRGAGEGSWVLSPRRLRGRGETQSFKARMEHERRRELVVLADRLSVSRFAHRGRLQSMLKLRSLERQTAVLDRMRCFPSRMDSDRPYNQSTISYLRNPLVEVQSPTGNGEISTNTSNAANVLFHAECSGSPCSTEQFDGSWAGRCSSQSISWHSDEDSNSRRGWRVARRHDSSENFTDNVEIRELLDRRRVSTSLTSDFSDKMNKLISSFIQRRQRAGNCFYKDLAEHQNLEQVDSVSSSLEREAVHELRSEMARIRNEIRELRQMVESCMEWQGRLERTIEQDISGWRTILLIVSYKCLTCFCT
ncbi:uncharacterized protein LOC122041111 isoform X1 [Zingiber officinale]|uniref:uncharacterized protein LOC122041111 isoform X1 n=1 Tax=Zingiber officinale TaxID=94328 RepID=UPI001C4BECAB|nr:uncharacterized protein LOC122041111 isoform X1 [Zingiber officinale]XP_042456628.1 uncharacterized protein LOC122041111 isoform X1 [Zingiber officinale]